MTALPLLYHFVFLSIIRRLSLAWYRALHKGALLLVELAQHAKDCSLVDHTAALPSPTGVARPLTTGPDIVVDDPHGGDWLGLDQVLLT